jgi:PDZ domain-containing secreted protein
VVLSIDGRPVDSVETARTLIQRRRPGDRMRIVYERWGRPRSAVAVLEPQRAVF